MTQTSKEKQGDFTLRLPKDRTETEFFEVQLRDIDESTYNAAAKLITAGKEVEVVKFVLKNLYVGGDSISDVLDNFISVRSASEPVLEILNPATGELKKN